MNFDWLLRPFGYVLSLFNDWTSNYLFALLLFAVVIEILLLPFSIKQQKNSIKQAKLRPKEMAIRKKYAGRTDQATQQKAQTEIMELYQKENYNPASGCLPLLIQMPFLIGLYNVVISPLRYVCGIGKDIVSTLGNLFVEPAKDAAADVVANFEIIKTALGGDLSVRSASQDIYFIDHLKDLLSKTDGVYDHPEAVNVIVESLTKVNENGAYLLEGVEKLFNGTPGVETFNLLEMLPNFELFGGAINLLKTPSLAFDWLILVPILTFVFSLVSSKVIRKFSYQPTAAEGQQNNISMKIMEYSMPLMSVWICFMVPSAIGVYWMFKQILSMFKQILLAKLMPLPKFTEEDYKEAEREYAGKSKKKQAKEKDPNKPKVRSLHHIDDEDFEDTKKPAAPEPKKEIAAPEEKSETIVEEAPLKDESDRKKK